MHWRGRLIHGLLLQNKNDAVSCLDDKDIETLSKTAKKDMSELLREKAMLREFLKQQKPAQPDSFDTQRKMSISKSALKVSIANREEIYTPHGYCSRVCKRIPVPKKFSL